MARIDLLVAVGDSEPEPVGTYAGELPDQKENHDR